MPPGAPQVSEIAPALSFTGGGAAPLRDDGQVMQGVFGVAEEPDPQSVSAPAQGALHADSSDVLR
jgi:hypothetical protein